MDGYRTLELPFLGTSSLLHSLSRIDVLHEAHAKSTLRDWKLYYRAREMLAAANSINDIMSSVLDNLHGIKQFELYLREPSTNQFELFEIASTPSRAIDLSLRFDLLNSLENRRGFTWSKADGAAYTFMTSLSPYYDYANLISLSDLKQFINGDFPSDGALAPLNVNGSLVGYILLVGNEIRFDGDRANPYHFILYVASLSRDMANAVDMLDALTGLKPRKFMDREFSRIVSESKDELSLLSVIIFDLDHFKSVNDTYGHQSGDRVLSNVARAVRRVLRKSEKSNIYHISKDSVAEGDAYRYGGEEFVVIIKGNEIAASRVANRIREEISKIRLSLKDSSGNVHEYTPRVSMGIRTVHYHELDSYILDEIIQEADRGLYFAKENGRDSIVMVHKSDDGHLRYEIIK